MVEKERVKTGIEGLDALLESGIPRNNLVVVSGNPGAGKSILTMQYLYNGATLYDEPGVLISLELPRDRILSDARSFGWDFDDLEKKGLLEVRHIKLYDFEKLKTSIEDSIEKFGAKRLVIDPGAVLRLFFERDLEVRKAILELGSLLKKLDCTSLITTEPAGETSSLFGLEAYVADGVILLYHTKLENEFIRTIAVMKMRGTGISEKLHPLQISSKGITVLSDQEVFQTIPRY